jgi:hypothetical protein
LKNHFESEIIEDDNQVERLVSTLSERENFIKLETNKEEEEINLSQSYFTHSKISPQSFVLME